MRFHELVRGTAPGEVRERIEGATRSMVLRALAREHPTLADAPALLSEAAGEFLEEMARRARRITLARFGRTMTLYAPIYLSNHCVNLCRYCGFAADRRIPRVHLTTDEAAAQAEYLFSKGIRHILLLTGEAPNVYGLDRVAEVARAIRGRAASVSVEIFPTDLAGYRLLADAGVDGLTLYQETYDRDLYREQHPAGPKADYDARLDAVEAGGEAGFRSLGIGALLGLGEPMVEAFYTAWHCDYLTRRFPMARVAISFPRLRPVPDGTPILHQVTDRDLVQMILVMRLLFPDADLVISTREPAWLRDRLMLLGVTRMSAGSRTSPGGYGKAAPQDPADQFHVDDTRSVEEVVAAVRRAGLDVVTKDFDPAFLEVGQ